MDEDHAALSAENLTEQPIRGDQTACHSNGPGDGLWNRGNVLGTAEQHVGRADAQLTAQIGAETGVLARVDEPIRDSSFVHPAQYRRGLDVLRLGSDKDVDHGACPVLQRAFQPAHHPRGHHPGLFDQRVMVPYSTTASSPNRATTVTSSVPSGISSLGISMSKPLSASFSLSNQLGTSLAGLVGRAAVCQQVSEEKEDFAG